MARTLTGLRANNDLHIGNYLGAMQPMVQRQRELGKDDSLFMFIPELHSFTTPIDHSKLYESSLNNVRLYMAAGLDPDHRGTVIYRQSRIPAHSEMALIFMNFVYFGEARRMTEFKNKSEKLSNKSVSVGLLTYPILMAADILLYDADYVPVGDDQKQHLELTRTLAERLNNKFGDIFKVPKSWQEQLKFVEREKSVRVMSLADPTNKMSKSVDDPKGTITLLDDPAEARQKVMSAETDSVGKINYDVEKQPGISNLLHILALLSDKHLDEVVQDWQGQDSYGDLKTAVGEVVEKFLTGFQSEYQKTDHAAVEEILAKGESEASKIAEAKLLKVQKVLGLRR